MNPDLKARWDRAGLASGHAWATCDQCGEEALQPRGKGRRCFLTSGCQGHMIVPPRLTPLQAVKAGLITLDEIRSHPPLELPATLRRLLAEGTPMSDQPPTPEPDEPQPAPDDAPDDLEP